MKKEEWIKGEISKWRSEGVIDGTAADALLARYKVAESRIGWGAIVAGSFGALLIGLGVIAIFAANWDHLGRAERAIVAIAPLLACGIAAVVAKARGWRAMTLWEPLGILWFVSTIAATCLVAQTYNVGGKVPDLVLFVAVLTLPVVWITRSAVAMSVWPVLAFVYAGVNGDLIGVVDANTIVNALLMLAASIPAYVAFLRRHPPRTTLVRCQIVMGLVYSFGMAWMLAAYFDCSLQAGILVFWGCAALVLGAGATFRLPVWPMVAIITASLAATASVSPNVHLSIYVVSLALAVVTTAYGIVKRQLSFMNVGSTLLLYLILAKFFMSEADFTVKGIVLIAAGAVLATLNVALVRAKRRA